MANCAHPDKSLVRRMASYACPACGEMWAVEDEVGNYKDQYDAEHEKHLKLQEAMVKERNAATEKERRLNSDLIYLRSKVAVIKKLAREAVADG